MFLQGDCVVTSASDLASASTCEFAFLRALDAKLGRIEAVIENDDPLRRRAARSGIGRSLVTGSWRCPTRLTSGMGHRLLLRLRRHSRPSRSELLSSSRRVFV